MKKKMISVLFAVILAFLLVAEGVIPVQAANNTPAYNIRFFITDTQNNIHSFLVPAAAPTSYTPQQSTWKLDGTGQIGPFISNATMQQYGIQQRLEFDVMRICSEVAVTTNTPASFSVSGNHVSMQTLSTNFTPGTTIDIVISGKHEPMANSITAQPATCTTEGREIATCSKCYQQYVSRTFPIDPNRHGGKSIKKIDKDATCTEAGQYHCECEKCGTQTIGKQTIPAKGHTWTNSGSGRLVCSVCGKKSEAKASGMYYGIPWEMDAEGNLTLIGGTCTNKRGFKWVTKGIKTVKCDSEIICNDYFCKDLFNYNTDLVSADLSEFNTSNVTDMSGMFSYCTSLTSLDVSSFDTSNVTNMGDMFSGCENLASLDLSNFNASNVTGATRPFSGCNKLEVLTTPKTVGTTNIDLPFTMYDKNGNEYNKITVTNIKLYKEPQFKIFVNKTVRIKGIAIGSRRIKVSY